MNKQLKEKWIAALRSGEYEQGRNYLRTGTGKYCCLGVLCNLIDPTKWDRDVNNSLESTPYDYDGSIGYPSPKTIKVSGLDDGYCDILTGMNDVSKLSFNQIADWIEENL